MNNRALKIMTVVFIIFVLCACSSKKEDDKPAFDISGKTYYSTVDDFNHSDHAKVWFGRNGTFVLNDSYKDGYYEMNGTWELNEDVCTLNVENDSSFSKVIFEVKDDDTIVLKTTLLGSRSDSIFSTTETKGSNSSSSNTNNNASSSETKPEESKPETDSKPKDESSTKDVPCTGLSAPYHNYWAYEGVKNWDLEIVRTPENTTDKITYKSNDEKVVKVDENGNATTVSPGKTTIDITCGSQKLTIGFETRSKDPAAQPLTYKAKVKDVNDQFQPKIYLDGKGSFV
nr:Ig-like domain-containing protein [Erysipelotrichaceae bacterium]